jgi:uncharacterized membrane protein
MKNSWVENQTLKTCSSASSTCRTFYFWKTLKSRFSLVFQSFVFGQILAVLGRICCIGNGWEHAQSNAKILKTLWLINHESKYYMEWIVGKLSSISNTSKRFKKSTNILCSQHLAQKCKKPFWLPSSFRD